MANINNEEDYLDSLLNSLDPADTESAEEKEERIMEEQVKESVKKIKSDAVSKVLDYSELADTGSGNKISEETETPVTELREEYKELFEPENETFSMSDIPDREPEELSQKEINRLASMQLDELLEDVSKSTGSKDDVEKKEDNKEYPNKNAQTDAQNTEAVNQEAGEDNAGIAPEINSDLKKSKKEKKEKPKKETSESEPKKKFKFGSFIKSIFFEDIEKEIEAENSSEDNLSDQQIENQQVLHQLFGKDAEGELLEEDPPVHPKSFFGKLTSKFSSAKAKAAESAKEEEEAEEQEKLERQRIKEEKKAQKKEKNSPGEGQEGRGDRRRPDEEDEEENPKKKKTKKAKKPKKQKKPKEPPKPQDILKVKPKSIILLILFVAGVVILVQILNSSFYYERDVSQAKYYFQNGNYLRAYESLQGVSLKEADQKLHNQVSMVMYMEKQYISYQNYMKINMRVEALDSLIKGVQRYYAHLEHAEELGVREPFEAVKEEILKVLSENFNISEEKAISYAELSEIDFTQYYYTIETYGGK